MHVFLKNDCKNFIRSFMNVTIGWHSQHTLQTSYNYYFCSGTLSQIYYDILAEILYLTLLNFKNVRKKFIRNFLNTISGLFCPFHFSSCWRSLSWAWTNPIKIYTCSQSRGAVSKLILKSVCGTVSLAKQTYVMHDTTYYICAMHHTGLLGHQC